jgi:glycosyltransferase involved in cell wall biosynthesis
VVQQPGPRKDYVALARALDATVLDYTAVERSPWASRIARRVGLPVAQAVLASRWARDFDAILTDGEHIGIPLAALLKAQRSGVAHVTIGHRIAAEKKRPFFRWLKLHSHMDAIAVHARAQRDLAISRSGIPARRVAFVPYQVDTDFWTPQAVPEEDLISSAGLEYRDYPTLFRAVEGLSTRVAVGAASYWSRRRNTASDAPLPENVSVGAYDYFALRDLYARSAVVVVPLQDVDFQAGITVILEAMAMGKPVIVSHTWGQTDAVEDRRSVTRGVTPGDPSRPASRLEAPPPTPRTRPVSLLRELAAAEGLQIEPNGMYVLPGDAGALREAITFLMAHPEERARLGAAGRRLATRLLTVDHYASRLGALVREAYLRRQAVLPRGAGVAPAPEQVDGRPGWLPS